jgi:catechol 2,3-dioxygenase-like lactoylglutathione lyase family enzyme
MNFKSVNTIIYCRHWAETVSFYRDVLGLPGQSLTEWLVEFEMSPDARLSVADETRTTIRSAGGTGITITIEVRDAHRARQCFETKGCNPGVLRVGKLGGDAFFMHDPEGTRLEFWSKSPETAREQMPPGDDLGPEPSRPVCYLKEFMAEYVAEETAAQDSPPKQHTDREEQA